MYCLLFVASTFGYFGCQISHVISDCHYQLYLIFYTCSWDVIVLKVAMHVHNQMEACYRNKLTSTVVLNCDISHAILFEKKCVFFVFKIILIRFPLTVVLKYNFLADHVSIWV